MNSLLEELILFGGERSWQSVGERGISRAAASGQFSEMAGASQLMEDGAQCESRPMQVVVVRGGF